MSIEQVISHPVTYHLVAGIVFISQLYLASRFGAIEKELIRRERKEELLFKMHSEQDRRVDAIDKLVGQIKERCDTIQGYKKHEK